MPYLHPDTPPVAPEPFPATAPGPGPAPVPFTGPDQSAGNPHFTPAAVEPSTPAAEVLGGVSGPTVLSSSLAAPNVNPYFAGSISPIYAGGDNDAGGRDDVAGSVAEAVHAAEARFSEHQSDLHAGGHIGDFMKLPSNGLDPGVGSYGETEPAGSYYDPPRNYGG